MQKKQKHFDIAIERCVYEMISYALSVAAKNNDLQKVKFLINNGANDFKDEYGETPLHKAAWNNSCDVVKILIDNGVNVNATDNGKETPLHKVAWSDACDVVKVLQELV